MKELIIISGKGGTGKTSMVASLAYLARQRVVVDADVDAADLHLVTDHKVLKEESFKGGSKAEIDPERCNGCGICLEKCHFNAISDDFFVDTISCEGCGVCAHFCPAEAIKFERRVCGKWYVSQTQQGPMVHAKLGIAEENSGLLVSLLRREARAIAEKEKQNLIIVDGPPGIGCPVIASVTGADAVLVVTEPTLSGMHDLKRVRELAAFLKVQAMLCVNKFDLNPDVTESMKAYADSTGMLFAGVVPYDTAITAAMVEQKSLVEFSDGRAASAVKEVWGRVEKSLFEQEEKFKMAF